jgi:hypothetical protein
VTEEKPDEKVEDQEKELVDPALCEQCGFKGTPLCTHPDGYYQDEPAGLNKLIADVTASRIDNITSAMMNKTLDQKERDQDLVNSNLNFLYDLFPDEVKEWIYRQWPYALLDD